MTSGREILKEYFGQVVPARYFQSPRVRRDGRIHESLSYVVYTSRDTGHVYRWTNTHALLDGHDNEVLRLRITRDGAGFVCRSHGPTASIFQVAELRDGYRVKKLA